jgi:uncharacterized protein YndB with AHSA1/START domain
MTVVRLERRIEHPIEAVWEAIATPTGIRGWLGTADLDLTKGGAIRLQFDKTVGNVVKGHVTEIDPPNVLEYTFGQPDSILRWELTEQGPHKTLLTLTHTLPSDEQRADAAAGWHTLLDMIPAALDGEDPTWTKERWDEVRAQYA